MNTYLGQKGYTILKAELTADQLNQIKKDLTIRPYVPGAPVQDTVTFPAYRESAQKIYVPHYYGVEQYGPPKEYKISEGEDIDLEFVGQMREQQQIAVNTYVHHVTSQQYGGGLLELPCGAGKCLGKDTEILMFDGTFKKVQDVIEGDLIMGDDSTPRRILSLARGREQMYKIINDIGESYICNESHILSLSYKNIESVVLDISVKRYLSLPPEEQDKLHGYKVPISFQEKKVDLNPYLFGFWIYDQKSPHVITQYVNDFMKDINYTKTRIPKEYKVNSSMNQRLLLAGFMDASRSQMIIHENEGLIEDFIFVCRSLGFPCHKKAVTTAENVTMYEIIYARSSFSSKLQIEKLEVDDYYGFEIDGNRRFVLADFTVTHNTVDALKIISMLKKKAFIIVHKEFLMNQWIERIQQFLPKAKIGKIQGQVVDVDNKDIVIGMLQSLSMKEYPASLFERFGLTIIDEVHHISSQVFSNSLFKLVTKYMLGLSATMNRKDGTTKVFKMFLGDVVYKGQRDEVRSVTVRAIDYYVNDDEFNKEAMDQRGNPAYSTMISKLCEYNRRTEFILTVLVDMLRENPNQQIMFLAHNKNVLKYLHDAIQHRNIATVGYYIGGMKESALKETESKKIVIATYSMAAEALDIKTLSTLIMVTPKTDIEQSVGRILREKHSQPIVVDIIDSHSIFQSQWKKRKAFYKKENYKIIHTTNAKYATNCWETLFEPGTNTNGTKCSKKDKEREKEKDGDLFQGVCLLKIPRTSL